jgi:hypothetical protein
MPNDLSPYELNFENTESKPEDSHYDLSFKSEPKSTPEIKEKPSLDWRQKLEVGTLAVHKGVLNFTSKILSMIPSDTLRSKVQQHYKSVENDLENVKQKYDTYIPQVGEFTGEMLATAPVGAALGGVMRAASALGKMAPLGLQTLVKYGAGVGGSAAVMGGQEAMRYNPEKPDEMINTQAAGQALSNPLTYGLGALGTKLGTYAQNAQKYGDAQKILPGVFPRDTRPAGLTNKILSTAFDSIPTITGFGKRVEQLDNLGDDLRQFVTKVSGSPEALHAKDLEKMSASALQKGLKGMVTGERELWSKPFKTIPISDADAVRKSASMFSRGMESNLNELPISLNNDFAKINSALKDKNLTVDSLKNAYSAYGSMLPKIWKAKLGNMGREAAEKIKSAQDDIMSKIESTLHNSGNQGAFDDFIAAREYSQRWHQYQRELPKIQKALTDETAARQLVKGLISDSTTVNQNKLMSTMDKAGQAQVQALKISKALEAAEDGTGKINIPAFLKATGESSSTPELFGKNYETIKGLNKLLGNINSATQAPTLSRSVGALGAVGMGAAAASGVPGGAAAVVALPVLTWAVNHPVAKNLLARLSNNVSKSQYEYITNRVQSLLIKGGFNLTNDENGNPALTEKK